MDEVQEFAGEDLKTLAKHTDYLMQLMALALKKGNLYFVSSVLKHLSDNEKVLITLYETLGKCMSTATAEQNPTLYKIMLLRAYNAAVSLLQKNKSEAALSTLGKDVDFTNVFRELRLLSQDRQIRDPVTDKDLLATAVELQTQSLHEKSTSGNSIRQSELVEFLWQSVSSEKFLAAAVQLIHNLGDAAPSLTEDLILRIKQWKIAAGGLPGSLCKSAVAKEAVKIKDAGTNSTRHERILVGYLLIETAQFDQAREILNFGTEAGKTIPSSPLEDYLRVAAMIESTNERAEDFASESPIIRAFAEAKKLCAELKEAEACEVLSAAIAEAKANGGTKQENSETAELKRIYKKIFTEKGEEKRGELLVASEESLVDPTAGQIMREL